MGTSLTGTTPQDTYDSLIKVTDNGPISGTLKALSDGLGNDSTLSLSTTAASIAGTLAVAGAATFDTTTLVVDAANNRVGVGVASPAAELDVANTVRSTNTATTGFGSSNFQLFAYNGTAVAYGGGIFQTSNTFVYQQLVANQTNIYASAAGGLRLATANAPIIFGTGNADVDFSTERMRITSTGNVGIGIDAPTQKLEIQDGAAGAAFRVSNSGGGNAQLAISSNATSVATLSFTNSLTLSGGVVSVSDGIQFPATQVPSADPNTLDDYEEGTFTPTLNFDGDSVGITYVEQAGKYTKVGNKVSFAIVISLSSKGSSTGNARIAGLPFNISLSSGADFIPFTIGAFVNITFADVPAAVGITNNNYFVLDEMVSGAPQTALTNADFSNSSFIRVSGFYFV